ncbi:ATP-dependent Lon protease [Clostridium acetobutylicum]|nr:ATP-dependent Lon protease [Clostridium acetobutylicum]
MENKNTAVVIPIWDVNLLPDMDYTIKLNNIDKKMLNYLNDDTIVNIALPLNKKVKLDEISEDDFYEIGIIFDITEIEKISDGYKINIKAIDRVNISAITFENTAIFAEYKLASDILDLSEADIEKTLFDIKEIVHEISKNFTESDLYTKKSR